MPTIEMPESVPQQIEKFMHSVNFKKTTVTYIASRIPEEKIQDLRQAFQKLDVNGDGVLSKQELMKGVMEIPGCNIQSQDWDMIVDMMDTNKNGNIDYTEFIAACMQSSVYANDETQLKSAFEFFDKDKNGSITIDELRQTLRDDHVLLSDSKIEALIREVDFNQDGVIDYHEFIKMMKEENLI